MLRRLILGLVLGLIVGGGSAAGLVRLGRAGVSGRPGGDLLAYLSAAVAGVLTGLVAGQAHLGVGREDRGRAEGRSSARSWAAAGCSRSASGRRGFEVPTLTFLGAGGPRPVGDLPAASLPLIAAVLGGLFGLDNTDDADDDESAAQAQRKRVSADAGRGAKASRATTRTTTANRRRLASSARSAECRPRGSSSTSATPASSG